MLGFTSRLGSGLVSRLGSGLCLSPIVVLVRPQMGENIGMSARAMRNCGLGEMRLVSPRDGWPNPSAISAARGAVGVLEGVRVFEDLGEAVADCARVMATSARVRDRNISVYSPGDAVLSMRDSMRSEEGKCAVLFGPENNGLGNEDMSYADGVIRADLDAECCSMNLAMAVFMVCWEWRRVMLGVGDGKDGGRRIDGNRGGDVLGKCGDIVAKRGDVVRFMKRLEEKLEGRGFYRSKGQREEVRLNLRAVGMRARISEQELRTLEGVMSALLRERKD